MSQAVLQATRRITLEVGRYSLRGDRMGTLMQTRKLLLTVGHVADATGLDESTIRGHLDRGEWPGLKVGSRRRWRMPATVLEALIAGRDPSALKT